MRSATHGEIITPEHFGFCEGVVAADDLMRDAIVAAKMCDIEIVYGYHDIVHNASVRREHEERGAVFVKDASEVPDRQIVVPSAHGTSLVVMQEFANKGCLVLDAVCPLVVHTHKMVQAARRNAEHLVYILKGKPGVVPESKLHDEVVGTVSYMDYAMTGGELVRDPMPRTYIELDEDPRVIANRLADESEKFRVVTQTTLDADACFDFRNMFTEEMRRIKSNTSISVSREGDVCKAVRDRQQGVRVVMSGLKAARAPGAMVVVTDPNSKNGMGYYQLASELAQSGDDVNVLAIASREDIKNQVAALKGRNIGLTASASTPDSDIASVLGALGVDVSELGFERPRFHLRHGDGTSLKDPDNIRKIIKEWQEAA